MKHAQLIVVKLNTVARMGNESMGPFDIYAQVDFKKIIQRFFKTHLKGIQGHIIVKFNGKLWMCERDNVNPDEKPYVRHSVKYHPLADKFTIPDREPAALLSMGEPVKKKRK